MTHIPGKPVAFEPPGEWRTSQHACRKCRSANVAVRTHQSSCGGWEDDEFRCNSCGLTWWVDGIDS